MAQKPSLKPVDYLTLLYIASRGILTATYTTLTGWSRGTDCPATYKKHVIYSVGRIVSPLLSVRVGQAIQPWTVESYESFTKANKFEPVIVELEDTSRACWFGRSNVKKVLVWFHGGGYAFPASSSHHQLCLNLVRLAGENGKDLGVLLPEYDLAPHRQYPSQLSQGVYALKYLLDSGMEPSQIIIAGDSAGGNLAVALLGHLSHPHPNSFVPSLFLPSTLAGALLVSPWASFDHKAPSFLANQRKDVLAVATLRIWSDSFMGKAAKDNYNHPANAEVVWWEGLKVEKVGIVAGGHEILVDDITRLVERMKVHNPDLEYFNAPGVAHAAIIMSGILGIDEKLLSKKFIYKWVLDRL